MSGNLLKILLDKIKGVEYGPKISKEIPLNEKTTQEEIKDLISSMGSKIILSFYDAFYNLHPTDKPWTLGDTGAFTDVRVDNGKLKVRRGNHGWMDKKWSDISKRELIDITGFSKEKIKEVAGGDEDFMAVVAQTFLEEIPPDLQALQEAVENDNKELAYQFAHKMKPNFEMFGVEVSKEVLAIESWTKTSKKQGAIEQKLLHVVTTVKAVLEELKEDFNL